MDNDTEKWLAEIDDEPTRNFWTAVSQLATVLSGPGDRKKYHSNCTARLGEITYREPKQRTTHLGCPDQNCPCPKNSNPHIFPLY